MNCSCKTIDWEKIKEKVDREDWARATVEVLKQGFENHNKAWGEAPPLEPSDWSHHYFCRECAVRLEVNFDKPHEHKCSACGKIYSGEPYDGAWRKMIHGAIVTNLERAAILANIIPENKKYSNYVRDIILYYAENYQKYEIHGKNAGKGKVFPQCLTEAIFVIAIERTLRWVSELNLFSPLELQSIGEKFFRPAAELLKPQVNQIHNIHAWMDAAIAACGYFLEDKELIEFSIDGEFGWINQVEQGVTKDGLWYEISPTYHLYTVSALLSLAWLAKEMDRDLFNTPKFKNMATIPVEITYENGEFPAYNDSWYGINISKYTDTYEQFNHIYEDRMFKDLLSRCYKENEIKECSHIHSLPNPMPTPATAYPRNSISALLFSTSELTEYKPVNKQSRLFEVTGIGILENENLRIGLKFNPHGGGHDHYDKLTVDVFADGELISGDLGTSGYGVELTTKWNRTSAAHNLVVINRERQKPCGAKLLSWNAYQIEVETDGAYQGTQLKRNITLEENGFIDYFEVKCEEESVIDWIFHCKGNIESNLPFESIDKFSGLNGYDQITDLRRYETNDEWTIRWQMLKAQLTLSFDRCKDTEIFTGKCFGSNGLEQLGIVIVRRREKDTAFNSRFRYIKN
jgi:hypothetical protein